MAFSTKKSDRRRVLVFLQDIDFEEFLGAQLRATGFEVQRADSFDEARVKLADGSVPIFIAPDGWKREQTPLLATIIDLRRILAIPSESIAQHPEPRALIALMERYVERQELLDDLLARICRHHGGTSLKDAQRRILIDLPINCEFAALDARRTTRTLNVSPSGFFAKLPKDEALPQPGEMFRFSIEAPESRLSPISGSAIVQWIHKATETMRAPQGLNWARGGFGARILHLASASGTGLK